MKRGTIQLWAARLREYIMHREGRSTIRSRIASDRGLSILEAMVGTVIVSIGLLGTAALLAGILKANDVSRNITMSAMLAQDKMESLKTLGYFYIGDSNTTTAEDYGSINGFPRHRRVTSIHIDSPSTGMKTATVQVFWGARPQPFTINAFLTR